MVEALMRDMQGSAAEKLALFGGWVWQSVCRGAALDHRVKNVLATVSAIIAQTQEASGSRADFVTGLNSRINSLARTQELLSESNWRGAWLAEIVRREFAPYTRGNTEARGPSVTLKAEAIQAVATVLYELTTNAAKYGALSNAVACRSNGGGYRMDRMIGSSFEWRETGGPRDLASSRSGYGTSIIRELIPFELGGAVELSFATEGARCLLEIPCDWVSKDRRRTEENEYRTRHKPSAIRATSGSEQIPRPPLSTQRRDES